MLARGIFTESRATETVKAVRGCLVALLQSVVEPKASEPASAIFSSGCSCDPSDERLDAVPGLLRELGILRNMTCILRFLHELQFLPFVEERLHRYLQTMVHFSVKSDAECSIPAARIGRRSNADEHIHIAHSVWMLLALAEVIAANDDGALGSKPVADAAAADNQQALRRSHLVQTVVLLANGICGQQRGDGAFLTDFDGSNDSAAAMRQVSGQASFALMVARDVLLSSANACLDGNSTAIDRYTRSVERSIAYWHAAFESDACCKSMDREYTLFVAWQAQATRKFLSAPQSTQARQLAADFLNAICSHLLASDFVRDIGLHTERFETIDIVFALEALVAHATVSFPPPQSPRCVRDPLALTKNSSFVVSTNHSPTAALPAKHQSAPFPAPNRASVALSLTALRIATGDASSFRFPSLHNNAPAAVLGVASTRAGKSAAPESKLKAAIESGSAPTDPLFHFPRTKQPALLANSACDAACHATATLHSIERRQQSLDAIGTLLDFIAHTQQQEGKFRGGFGRGWRNTAQRTDFTAFAGAALVAFLRFCALECSDPGAESKSADLGA